MRIRILMVLNTLHICININLYILIPSIALLLFTSITESYLILQKGELRTLLKLDSNCLNLKTF